MRNAIDQRPYIITMDTLYGQYQLYRITFTITLYIYYKMKIKLKNNLFVFKMRTQTSKSNIVNSSQF